MLPCSEHENDQASTRYFVALVFPVLLVAGGCQTVHYTPATLPKDLCATPRASINQLYLGGITPPGAGSDLLGPDDLLDVTVNSGIKDKLVAPYVLRVSQSGAVQVPIIGEVQVAGVEPAEAGRRITAAAQQRGLYRQPQVTVVVTEKAMNQVLVLGAVSEPGAYELPRGNSDIVSALAAAGGLTEEADPKVEVMRRSATSLASGNPPADGGVQTVAFEPPIPSTLAPTPALSLDPAQQPASNTHTVDLSSPGGIAPSQSRLGDRDVLLVRAQDGDAIHVSGLVRDADQFELPPGRSIYLLDAIAMAGGRTSPIADRVYIIRQSKQGGEPTIIQASISKAKKSGKENLLLAPGDLVSVEPTVATTVADVAKSFFRVSLGISSRFTTF